MIRDRSMPRPADGAPVETTHASPRSPEPDAAADRAFDQERAETVRTRLLWLLPTAAGVWVLSFLWVDGEVFTRAQALAVRVPQLVVTLLAYLWLRRPRSLGALEVVVTLGFGLITASSGLGLLHVPHDRLPAKVASLVLTVFVVCPVAALPWRSTLATGVLTTISLSTLLVAGERTTYFITLTIVGFAYFALAASAAARDRLKRRELMARRALEEANQRLEHEDALRRRLFVNLSHDFRTPLAVIRADADALRGPGRSAEEARTIDRMESNARVLADLADQLLDLARLEAGQMPLRPTTLDLRRVVRDVAALLAPSGAEHKLVTALPDEPLVVHADAGHLQRIVTNLVVNALRQVRTAGAVTIAARRAGDDVHVDVLDDGPGVPADRRDAIFRRFVSFDSDGSTASGIGLPLARELARLGGGDLVLLPDAPRTTFRLSLPAHAGAPEEPATVPAAPAPRPSRPAPPSPEPATGARVLVVEDNEDMAEVLVRTLADRFRVEHVGTVARAKQALAGPMPDGILSDVLLPDGTGYDVLAEVLRKPERDARPVVLVSALGDVDERVRGLAAGAADYLPKPFAPAELRSRLQAAIERAEAQRRALEAQRDALLVELHDGVSASLSRAALLLQTPDADATSGALEAIRDGLDEARGIMTLLSPQPAELDALGAQIRRELADACRDAGLEARFETAHETAPHIVPAGVAHTLRRVAREATTNAIKHAGARAITARLAATADHWTLTVSDDGRGLPAGSPAGRGLGIMKRRAARVGGSVTIDSAPGAGVRVALTIPRS